MFGLFARTATDRVLRQAFDVDGKFLRKFGRPGSAIGEFRYADSVALDAFGNVFVADRFNFRVHIFKSDGTLVTAFGSLGIDDADANGEPGIDFGRSTFAKFDCPRCIAVDSIGRVFVGAESCRVRVFGFSADGAVLTTQRAQEFAQCLASTCLSFATANWNR